MKRKLIAVISGQQSNGNLTYLEGKDRNNNVLTANTGLPFQNWNTTWNQLCSVDQLILDLSYPYTHKKTIFEKYSFGDWIKSGFIKKLDGEEYAGVPGIPSGNVYAASEVLTLNEIPIASIQKVLSFLETDMLYALDNNTFGITLNNIISSQNIISIQNNVIIINGNSILLTPDEQCLVHELYVNNNLIIDLAHGEYKKRNSNNVGDILQIYNEFKNLKRGIINKVVNAVVPAIAQNFNIKIVEDEIYVAVISYPSPSSNVSSVLCKYDLLMIGDSTTGQIHKFGDQNYSAIWKNSLVNSFSVMDVSGRVVTCNFK